MLDPQSHGEGFGLQRYAQPVQHFKGIPGGVSGTKDQAPAGERFPPRRAGYIRARQPPMLDAKLFQAGFKAKLRPQCGQLPAEVLENPAEVVCSHMGLGIHQDLRRRSAGHQPLQDETVANILRAGVQFPVGKSSGAAFTELDIGFRVQDSRRPETLHVRPAFFHTAAPLQKNGPLARLRQHQGRKESRRARPGHYRPPFRRRQRLRQAVDRSWFQAADFPAPAAAEGGKLVFQTDRQSVGQGHIFPGVHTPAEDLKVPQVRRAKAQQLRGLGSDLLLPAAGEKTDAFKFNHGRTSFRRGFCWLLF